MSGKTNIWTCPRCGATLDISDLGFYTEVECPDCGAREYVHTRLANFKLLGVLGIGGMSVVFSAKDMILNRPIAIKVLNDTYKDQPERIARFENECAMMAKVRHENVVSVYSAGWARGQFYIAMERIKGRDLEHIVRNHEPMSPKQALEVTREVVYGLAAAGKAGLLHRDMKPGNVLISNADGKAKVLDFGLSLGNQAEDTEEVIWATPYYVAPETLMREKEDARTDIYALGMTVRFLLTGEDKLPKEYSSLNDLIDIKKKLPAFASQLPGVETAVADLVDHMTAFAQADRPLNYNELLLEINEVLAILHENEEAQSPARVRKRRMAWIGGACLTLLAGITGAGVTALLATPEPKQDTLEVQDVENWGELEVYDKLCKAIQTGDWTNASRHMEYLDEHAKEPTLAGLGALLRSYIALTDGDMKTRYRYLMSLNSHVKREGDLNPAGRRFFDLLKITSRHLLVGYSKEQIRDGGRSILRAFLQATLSEYFAYRDPKLAQTHADEARREFAMANERFRNLGVRMLLLTSRYPALYKTGQFDAAQRELAAHNFDACNTSLNNLSALNTLTPEEKSRVTMLKELNQVGAEVVELLKNRASHDYRPGMKPESMRSAASKLRVAGLDKEIYVLALMMQGDYKAAFDNNPYGKDPQSNNHFAVLLRHWQELLGMAPPPAQEAPRRTALGSTSIEPAPIQTAMGMAPASPLHVRKASPNETIQYMADAIGKGADVNAWDGNGDTPIHWALKEWKHSDAAKAVIKFLHEKGADINRRNRDGETPLDVSMRIYGADASASLYLIESGAKGKTDPYGIRNKLVATVCLIRSIIDANTEGARQALEHGANPNSPWVFDTTEKVGRLGSPGRTEIVRMMLDKGLNPNMRVWFSIMHQASEPATVELLLNRGANPNLEAGFHFTPLFNVGSVPVAEVLVKHGANVNFRTSDGKTPLYINWSTEMLQFLVKSGADVHAKTKEGLSVLHSTRYNSDRTIKAIRLFVDNGVDVNVTDNLGNTPLHYHIITWPNPGFCRSVLDYLLQRGADINRANNEGKTPLDLSISKYGRNHAVTRLLLDHGAQPGNGR